MQRQIDTSSLGGIDFHVDFFVEEVSYKCEEKYTVWSSCRCYNPVPALSSGDGRAGP